MSELLVYKYNTKERASEVLGEVLALKQEHVQKPLINLEDAAAIRKKNNGKLKIIQTMESAVKGGQVASGGFWGILIGFLFGGPLLGALLGVGISALLGRKTDLGIDNAFIKEIGEALDSEKSALFMLVDGTPIGTVENAMKKYGGVLYHTSLSKEAKHALSEMSKDETISEALMQEE